MTPNDLLKAVSEAPNLRTAASVVNKYLLKPGHSHLLARQLIEAFKLRCESGKAADARILAKHRLLLAEIHQWQTFSPFRWAEQHVSPPLSGGEENKGASRLPPGVPPAP